MLLSDINILHIFSSNKLKLYLIRFGKRIKSKITKKKDFYTVADIDLIEEIEQVTTNNQLDR